MVPLVLHTCAYTHPRAGLVCVCVFNSIGLLFLFWDYVNLIIRNFDTFLNFYFEMIKSQKAAKQHRGRADPHPASPRGGTSKLPHEAHARRRPVLSPATATEVDTELSIPAETCRTMPVHGHPLPPAPSAPPSLAPGHRRSVLHLCDFVVWRMSCNGNHTTRDP